MGDEYLWDRTGEPDAGIVRLEAVLGRYRYRRSRRLPALLMLAAVAAGLMVAGVLWVGRRPLSDWRMDGKRVAVGQTVHTGTAGGARLEAPFFGEVDLGADGELQVLGGSDGNQRLALRRGTMRALIWAPPTSFRVDTPSAQTIDLGCSYTLTVLADDSGVLTVQTGWVAFQSGARESFIPAGAVCHTRAGVGPGVPYFASASKGLQEGVARFEASGGRDGVPEIVAGAERRDSLTLWHLVSRTSGGDRELVVGRLAGLVPGVDAPGLLGGDREALDRAWNLLGLGETEWWRMWKRTFQNPAPDRRR